MSFITPNQLRGMELGDDDFSQQRELDPNIERMERMISAIEKGGAETARQIMALINAVHAKKTPAPVVNVAPAKVEVFQPSVKVESPDVKVEVAGPVIEQRERKISMTVKRDSRGFISSFEGTIT